MLMRRRAFVTPPRSRRLPTFCPSKTAPVPHVSKRPACFASAERMTHCGTRGHPAPRPRRNRSCSGPIAWTVEALGLPFGIMAAPDGYDTDVAPLRVEAMPRLELNRLRIAFPATFPGYPLAAEVCGAV